MLRWYCKFQVWWNQQQGSSMVEYALIAALIVIGLTLTLTNVRESLRTMFGRIITTLNNA